MEIRVMPVSYTHLVRSMLENDAYCIDILTQVSAINAALNSFNKVLIANHIRTLSLIHIS